MGVVATILACIAVSMALGSIHAFSVLIPGWESSVSSSRGAISLAYSFALASLTAMVLLGHHLFRRFSPPQIFLLVAVGAGFGLWLSGNSTNLLSIYIFYGCIFGAANGIGYGFALQLAGQIVNRWHGWSMAMVTAFYAVGAAASSQIFHLYVEQAGNKVALGVAAIVVVCVCLIAACITRATKVKFRSETTSVNSKLDNASRRLRLYFWFAYGSCVSAGLMIIGHAYTLLSLKHPEVSNPSLAPALVATGNITGGITAGLFAARGHHNARLMQFSTLTMVGLGLLLLPIGLDVLITFAGLYIVGFGYGALIALFPVVIADVFGKLAATRIYGQIFTAWGLAGLLAPWISGVLFDSFGSYTMSLLLATTLAAISLLFLRIAGTKY